MWIPSRIFNAIIAAYEARAKDQSTWANDFLTTQREQTEKGLDRVLAAKDAEVRAIIAAKDEEVRFMRVEVSRLSQAVAHERARAEAAIDQRLNLAGSPAVRDADLQRRLAEKEVAGTPLAGAPLPPELKTRAAQFAEAIAGVGEDEPEKEHPLAPRLAVVGGHPVN